MTMGAAPFLSRRVLTLAPENVAEVRGVHCAPFPFSALGIITLLAVPVAERLGQR
jgi:hypothetical protein